MGFRTYIGYINKNEYKKIKNMTVKEIYAYKGEDKEHGHVNIRDLVTELYEFGKYTDFDIENYRSEFFNNNETNNAYNTLYILNKEGFEYLINYYANRVKNIYNSMLKPFIDEIGDISKSEFFNKKEKEFGDNCEYIYKFDTSLITEEEQNQIIYMLLHIQSMAQEWGCSVAFKDWKPYDFNLDNPRITNSWKYEYSIFELVNIYKSFDYKKNNLVFYGC